MFSDLISKAKLNPLGSVVSSDAKGRDVNNAGPWDGHGVTRDILWDIGQAIMRLPDMPFEIIVSRKNALRLCFPEYGEALPLWLIVAPMFPSTLSRSNGNLPTPQLIEALISGIDFIEIAADATDDYVIVVDRSGNAALIDTR